MAVDETDRDFLRLLHSCDYIENVIAGMKMAKEKDPEKKLSIGNIVMMLEGEMLDSRWTDAKKDLTRIKSVIATGRAYWKS